MKPRMLTLLIFAGMLALAIGVGQDVNVLNAQTREPQGATLLKTDVAGMAGKEWNVMTVELVPGSADSRHVHPGAGVVYVLEGRGFLEIDGKPPVSLKPGAVAALAPEHIQILRNASQTQTLKVLVVLLEKGQPRLALTNQAAQGHQENGKQIPNGNVMKRKHSTYTMWGF